MDLRLQNKKVLISGSTRGIGLATAKAFAEEGAHVALSGRTLNQLKEAEAELKIIKPQSVFLSYQGDLTQDTGILNLADTLRSSTDVLDILVCNLGSGRSLPGMDLPFEEWSRVMEINFFSAMKLVTACLPFLKKSDNGAIIFVSSIAGTESLPAPIPYSAAKSAIDMASKNLARQLAKDHIRVNTVCPGNIYFKGGTWDQKLQENEEKVKDMLKTTVPQNRLGTPEEIASAIVFLASSRASFVTGSRLVIDGGQTVSL